MFIVDGRRGVRQTWLPALLAGVVFAVAQFVTANYISVQLTDIVASLLAAGSLVLLVRVWQPGETLTAELAGRRSSATARGHGAGARAARRRAGAADGADDERPPRRRRTGPTCCGPTRRTS